MSTIHSALTRAQQEKDAHKGPFPGSGNTTDPSRTGRGKRVLWTLMGIVLVFLLGYSGFLLAGRSQGEDAGEKLAGIPATEKAIVPVPQPEEPEEPETITLPKILDLNSQPANSRVIPAQGKLAAGAEKKEKPRAAGNKDSMARALVASQMNGEQSVAPRSRRPEGRPESFRSGHRRENAWTMAKDRAKFRGLPGMGRMPGISEDELEEQEDSRPSPEPVETVEPPAVIASRWYSRGLDSQMLGRPDEARAYYSRSLSEDPEYAPSLNNRAVIDMESGDMDAAREGFTQAMNADPEYVDPCYNLACLHARQGNMEEALSFLKMAAGMDKAVLEWVREDEDLASLRDLDEFKEVMND
ncbi:MAG: tetratricopeptide repeat protein [Desulfatibacillum sp.]|nr:tetratricopeptide repeat protein [Desulfatibacillum sp.]